MQESSDGTRNPGEKAGWRGYAQIAVIVVLIAVALFFARAPERGTDGLALEPGAEPSAPLVDVIRPVAEETAPIVHLTGTVRLEERITVISEVPGRVVWVSPEFTSGGFIAANETFLRVDPAKYELQVKAAEAAVKVKAAELAILRIEIEQEAAEELRESLLTRAEAELEAARIAQQQAERELAQTDISFPFDVRIVSTDAAVGTLAGPADLVGREGRLGIAYRLQALRVKVPIDLEDLQRLVPVIGRSAQVRTTSGSYETVVAHVSSVVAPKSRLASLFLRFPESLAKDALPLPGTFAEIAVEGPANPSAYNLPESVLQEQGRVWVVRDGAMQAVHPKPIGPTDSGFAVEAFDVGEGIIVGSLPGARDGLQVVVSNATAQE